MMQAATLRAVNLSCAYEQLFNQLNFDLEAGELLLIEGPNGAGKSTLLRIIAGIGKPDSGEIFWHRQSIYENLSDYWQSLHYMGHANGIRLGLTVAENLVLTQQLNLSSAPLDYQHLLAELKLTTYEHTQANCLSAGQKKKIALAKLFLFPKKLWLLDEPLTALDKYMQEYFLSCIKQHLNTGGLCIVSSHQPISIDTTHQRTLRLTGC